MSEMPAPPFGGLIKMPVDDWLELPDGPAPYYVGAKDGLFLHRRLQIGRGIVRITNWPDNFKKVGTNTGHFLFESDPIPAKLIGQIVHFFQRIYEQQQTEAAVLLTQHVETKEWGVFVPTQLVSHGGVNYVYDPLHIQGGRIVVGSIHSHANFSPFHSGTDTGDAADFDGLHCTVGFVNTTPKIVAMASMNKQNMHFGEDSFPALFDWDGVGKFEAPEWWDNYVGGSGSRKHTPIGNELYKKFDKPTLIKTERSESKVTGYKPGMYSPGYTPGKYASPYKGSEDYIERQMMSDWGIPSYGWRPGEHHSPPKDTTPKQWWHDKTAGWLIDHGYVWDPELQSYRWQNRDAQKSTALQVVETAPGATKESREFNARKAAEKGLKWSKDGALEAEEALMKELFGDQPDVEHWEDGLDEDIVSMIVNSACLNEEDVDYAIDHPEVASDEAYWRETFLAKAIDAVEVLQGLDVEIKLSIISKDEDGNQAEFLLPDDTGSVEVINVH